MENFDGLSQNEMKSYEYACNETKEVLINYLKVFCEQNNIDFLINHRIKNIDSINKKIANKGNEIYDIVGIRIVFCEQGYGVLANPIYGRNMLNDINEVIASYSPSQLIDEYSCAVEEDANGNNKYIFEFINFLTCNGYVLFNEKDYITEPKKSGYQSYHFVMTASNGKMVEVQVRNYLQHIFAEWEHQYYKTLNKGYSMDDLLTALNNRNLEPQKKLDISNSLRVC